MRTGVDGSSTGRSGMFSLSRVSPGMERWGLVPVGACISTLPVLLEDEVVLLSLGHGWNRGGFLGKAMREGCVSALCPAVSSAWPGCLRVELSRVLCCALALLGGFC